MIRLGELDDVADVLADVVRGGMQGLASSRSSISRDGSLAVVPSLGRDRRSATATGRRFSVCTTAPLTIEPQWVEYGS